MQTIESKWSFFSSLSFLFFSLNILSHSETPWGGGADFCTMPDMNAQGFKGRKVTNVGVEEGLLRFALAWIAGAALSLSHTFRERQSGDPE